jgi:serine/threonine protein kinase
MTLSAGTRLGPYEILSPLGAGGMGEVYRARDTRLAREVAIKVLPEALASDVERLRRFGKEAKSASALNHQNIVTIYDIGAESGVSFIAMELVEGTTLRELLAGDSQVTSSARGGQGYGHRYLFGSRSTPTATLCARVLGSRSSSQTRSSSA